MCGRRSDSRLEFSRLQWRDRAGLAPASSFRFQRAELTVYAAMIGVKIPKALGPSAPCGSSGEQTVAMTRLSLISHAATQVQRVAAFPLDEALGEEQITEIAALGWNAPEVRRVLSGPELRAQQTAQALGLSAVTTIELRDCDYGEWSGRKLGDIELENPEGIAAWLADPAAKPHSGESILNLSARVGRWLDAQTDTGHSIVVTHPAVIRSAILKALNAPAQAFWRIDIAPLSLTDLRFNGRLWTLRSAGCALRKS